MTLSSTIDVRVGHCEAEDRAVPTSRGDCTGSAAAAYVELAVALAVSGVWLAVPFSQ